jgi:protein-S-isoprenylcysteine O-methyltransferase Ste14
MWILRHAVAIAVLPVTAAILVPLWLCRRFGITFRLPATVFEWSCVAVALVFFLAGVTLFAATVFLFATRGQGTLAPWDPPAHHVVRGPYRFVRNPMISGVLLILIGESLFLRSPVHAAWAGAFLLVNLVYIPAVEEPQLEHRFGEAYRAYKRSVPRLLPRVRPWNEERF